MEFNGKVYVMGILNATPDSFSDGGQFVGVDAAVAHALKMISEGADIIDVGGESTRPGSVEVDADEEIRRVVPVIKAIRAVSDVAISIDTYKAAVAEQAIMAGATMINDVWGFQRDEELAAVAAKYNVPAILMHNQQGTDYAEDIIDAMRRFFDRSIAIALAAGVTKEQILLDPGIGFGKTVAQNLEVMKRLSEVKAFGYPVLLGTSRKSMIGNVLDLPVHERLEGTLVTTTLGVHSGMDIIRVHDVKENLRAIKMTEAIMRGQTWTQ